jgi:hypothetical protein
VGTIESSSKGRSSVPCAGRGFARRPRQGSLDENKMARESALTDQKHYDRGGSLESVEHAMRVRALFILAAVFICASITVAIAQEASIYGVFCETPEQAEMYILDQQEGNSPQDAVEKLLKQDKKYNCIKLHVTAVGIHQVGKFHTFLEETIGVFAVRVVEILPISGDQNHISGLTTRLLSILPLH